MTQYEKDTACNERALPPVPMSDLNLTLSSPETGITDVILLPPETLFSMFKELVPSLVGFPETEDVTFFCNGRELQCPPGADYTLQQLLVSSNDMVVVQRRRHAAPPPAAPSPARAAVPAPAPASSGGLDFSSLFANTQPSSSSSSSSTTSSSSAAAAASVPALRPSPKQQPAASSGLVFNLNAMGLPPSAVISQSPVSWPRMTLDDLVGNNPNPNHFISLLFKAEHSNCLKELNYHNPTLAKKLTSLPDEKSRVAAWIEYSVRSSIATTFSSMSSTSKEAEMTRRLRANPMDEEANRFFGEKIRKRNVEAQYREMIETFPEALGKILMLYVTMEINGVKFSAFVDSGAQMTIMSASFADKLSLLHLVDERFAGTAVGVGSAKILGKVHLAPMKVEGKFLPVSITVMDDKVGLGDKNMDFLLGLDMLKRHRMTIDLARNALTFMMDGKVVVAPFLSEYQLPVAKGGTMDYDVAKENEELVKRMEEQDKEEEERANGESSSSGLSDSTKMDEK